MEMKDWIMIGIGLVLSVGGALGSIVVTILTFFIKRLIGSVDKLTDKIEDLELDMKDRPQHDWVEHKAEQIADARVIKHESEKH